MKNNIQISTLTGKDVEELAKPDKNSSLAISFYLGIRADQDFLSVANSFLSEESKKIKENKKFSYDDQKLIESIFSDMERKLRVIKLPDRTRTFIVFFDNEHSLRIYKVPVYIPSKLVVERDLYIHPFIKNLQKYPHYGVVFLERDRARIFNYFWGEVEDETEEIISDVPQRMNAARATWKGLEERKIQNHIEVHINRHLKKIADRTEIYMKKNDIPHLVIGSHRELIERFKDYLSNETKKKIVGSYFIRTDQSLKRIKEKSQEVIDRFEFEKEREMIDRIVEGNSKKKKMAVLGIESVLERLGKYEVYTLAIGKNYASKGYLCPGDHSVYLRKGTCSVCKAPLGEVSDITDEIIESAIARKIRIIHFVQEHTDFDRFGIAAILK
jgi:peptide subunit release factor 1 (eRF1)